jgi:hypothetical protein
MAFTNTLIEGTHPGPDIRTWNITHDANTDLADVITHGLGFDPTFIELTLQHVACYTDTWYISAHSSTTITVTRVDNTGAAAGTARLTCGRIHVKR